MLEYLLYAAGGVLVLYWLLSTMAVGMVSFTNVLCAAGVGIILLGFLERRFGTLPAAVCLKKILLPLVLIGLVLFGVLEGIIISGAARRDKEPADYILILGAGLRKDKMSLTLLRRMNAALECDQGEIFVVSGGQGWNETIPEAEAMGDYLRSQGIPEERILREDRSTSTMENLVFSRALIEKHSGKPVSENKVKIVSSDFHCTRAQMLAKRTGYEQVSAYGAKTPPWVAPSGYIREAGAMVKSFFLDRE